MNYTTVHSMLHGLASYGYSVCVGGRTQWQADDSWGSTQSAVVQLYTRNTASVKAQWLPLLLCLYFQCEMGTNV